MAVHPVQDKSQEYPYPNLIYEYDLFNAGEEEWIRYDLLLTKLSDVDYDDKTETENTNEKLQRFDSLIEEAVVTVFDFF